MARKLFEAAQIGKLRLKNRIVMAPMGLRGLIEPDGRFSERAIDYYLARAKGGCGLIVTCVAFPDQEVEPHMVGDLWNLRPRLDSFMYVSRLSELADRLHHYGTKLAIQLSAGFGRVASPDFLALGQPVAPSPLPCFWKPEIWTRELTISEIEKIVRSFGVAAKTIKMAGIDAIHIHGHEGYLLDQFKTPLWNKRKDKYGGSLEGRLRFTSEIIQIIKETAGRDFPVIYRYGGKHYLEGGREIDESLEIARRLEQAGVDCLEVDAGCYETWYWPHPPVYQPPGCMVDMAQAVKQVVKIPVMAVGKLGDPELAERVLAEGKADFIALGRPLLADPEWANKTREGKVEDITPCIGCHEGCLHRANAENKYTSCAVNPTAGMEREYTPAPAVKAKRVLVVGGGPAGLEAARVAARRGHQVTLWEMSDRLGGNLISAAVPGFKRDLKDLLVYLTAQVQKAGAAVELNRKATVDSILEAKPEILLVATGSAPLIPSLPGMPRALEEGRALASTEFLRHGKEIGDSAIVVGGGFIGCEIAVHLAQMGKQATLVEMTETLAAGMPVSNRLMLLKMLADHQVTTFLKTRPSEITPQGAVVSVEGTPRQLQADHIILALGMVPRSEMAAELEGRVPQLAVMGDCARPGCVMNAVWDGFHAARII